MEGKEGSSSCSAPTAAVAHGSSRMQYVRGGQVLRLIKNREGILIRLGVVWRCRVGYRSEEEQWQNVWISVENRDGSGAGLCCGIGRHFAPVTSRGLRMSNEEV
ncbi:hypothetical protein F0562_022554 [Nyssa sinensis]|uniref:Uncharacterized protein n=1 Tax=Nyssa sinensis TaxID=561372 RepID=A0A5J5BS62_9ASTE|nr:hypothetical protein F0562_022554 [Nyssa sinensis]